MSWLKHPEKLFASNEKIKYDIKNGTNLSEGKNSTAKKVNTADTTDKDKNYSKSIIHGETSKQQSTAPGNLQKSDSATISGTGRDIILKKITPGKTKSEDKNNSGSINDGVLSVKDPTTQLESKENTSSGAKLKDLNFPTDNSTILKKLQTSIKENEEQNNSGVIINSSFGFVKNVTNPLESKKNSSSGSNYKEENLATFRATLKNGKTSKKGKKGKNSNQTINTNPTNPLESKESTSSGSKPKEANLPTENNTILKNEKTDKNNSQTINHSKKPKKPVEELALSWVNNPKKLLETEEGASGSNIKTNTKTSLSNNSPHKAAKNNVLQLDIVEQVIKNTKSNEEFKSLLEIVSNIMSNKNVKNRKTKINLFESFLESYQYANPNYMKQVKTTLKYCESQVTIASYFVDAKDFEGGDLAFFDGASGLLKGILSINNVKREALMKFNRYNNRYIQNEAAVLAQLKHANVIELLGYIASTKKDNVKKIFLEYMNLHDLARGLEDKEVDLSIENVKKIFIDLATGMEYVHSKKILHRDLRLSHFLYNNKNEYKIGGFDRAVYVGNSNGEYQSPVWESMLRVTKTLTPPEWDEMEKYTYTYKTDVYCMGYCFRIILRKRYPPLETQLEEIAKELEEFVFDNMFFEIPQCRKDFTKIKTFIQNLKI